MNKDFLSENNASRKKLLGTVSATNKSITDIYAQAADDLAREAGNAKDGSLTERWKLAMEQSLRERIKQLNGELEDAIRAGTGAAAGYPANANASWLDYVLGRAGHTTNSGAGFASVLARTSDEALQQVLSGAAYLDGKSLSKRIWTATGRLEGGIQDAIAQGIAQKMSAYELAKMLEAYVNPKAYEPYDWLKVYPDIPFPRQVEYHAQLLARTSINQAYAIANKEAALLNPFAEAIHWELSPSHYERQIEPFGPDICDEYAMHNEGLGVGNWPIKKVPLPHPLCLCYQYTVVSKSTDECAQELRAWLDGEPNEAMDKAFGSWKDRLLGDTARDIMDAINNGIADKRQGQLADIYGQDWYRQLQLTDQQAIDNVLIHASDEILAFWSRHGGLVKGNMYAPGGAYYSPMHKTISTDFGRIREDNRRVGETRNTLSFWHEAGHLFDYQAYDGDTIRNALGAFDDLLMQDYLAYANKILEGKGLPLLNSLSRLSLEQKLALSQDLYDDYNLKTSVSDLVGGLTNNRITNGWGHSSDYWKTHSPAGEAVAEMFEATMMQGERLQAMQQYFPGAYQHFIDTLRKLEGL